MAWGWTQGGHGRLKHGHQLPPWPQAPPPYRAELLWVSKDELESPP